MDVDVFDALDLGDDLLTGVVLLALGVVLLFLAGPFFGFVVLGVEALLALLVLPAAVAARLLLRRPWVLCAENRSGQRAVARISGWRASDAVLSEAARALAAGAALPRCWR